MGRRKRTSGRYQGVAALLVVAAFVLGLSYLPEARGVPVVLGRVQRMLLGQVAGLLPLALLLAGFVLAVAGERARFSRRVGAICLAVVTGITLYHSQVMRGDELRAGLDGRYAGVIGGGLVWLLRTAVGEIGAWVVLALAAVMVILLWTGLSLAAAIRGIWSGISVAGRLGGALLLAAAAGVSRAARTAGARLSALAARAVAAAPRAFSLLRAQVAALLPRPAPGPAPLPEAPMPASPSARDGEGGSAPPPQVGESPVAPAVEVAAVKSPAARAGKPQPRQESLALEIPSGGFQLPPLTLLNDLPALRNRGKAEPAEVARLLEQTLLSFGVEGKVVRWEQGPVVTRFEVQPAPGVRVQKFTSLTNDIALALAAPSVRIEAPIPGKSAVGVELPNQKTALVHIKEILETEEYRRQSTPLTVALGKDIAGHPILGDLAEMPHLLIAGATGSGKSVMLNAIIAGLLFRCTPLDVRLLMIDPKRVEFTHFNHIPHLLTPVVTNPRAAAGALKEMLREMEERFERFASSGVRNIQAYNQLPDGERLPYIVIIIDELADLMMVAPADFEDVICRLAQMTRATGIHMVLATQRPSVDVITGLIKANIPSRIAFAVSSQVDSRTILDMPGAEKLLGKGDMLYLPVGAARPVRAQGAFIADSEIQALVTWWKAQGKPLYDQDVLQAEKSTAEGEGGDDALLQEAARLIVRAGYGSVSLLQRKMKIGYVRAARIVDQLEEKGIVGPAQGSNPREVLVGVDELERLLKSASPR